jgi:hypothetical protein
MPKMQKVSTLTHAYALSHSGRYEIDYDKTKNGKRKGKLLLKNEEISGVMANTNKQCHIFFIDQ